MKKLEYNLFEYPPILLGTNIIFQLVLVASPQYCDARYQALPVANAVDCTVSPACDANSKFRPIDGSCANLNHPSWGQANTPYLRMKTARYTVKNEPRKSVSGMPLTSAREISTTLFPDKIVLDPIYTVNLMQFGQTIAHDFTNLGFRRTASGAFASCCTSDNKLLIPPDDRCTAFEVDSMDSFYRQFNVQCISLPRGQISNNTNCPKTETDQVNLATQPIDASFVYGVDKATAKRLRATGSCNLGKLAVYTTEDGRAFPPTTLTPLTPCDSHGNESVCYDTGDTRANQNIGITVYQIILFRLHNYLCDELHKINHKWDDDRLYHEARKILGAMLQHITFKHFLPLILGTEFLKKKGINYIDNAEDCLIYYNPQVNPGVYIEFSGAAYRSFHSMVPRDVDLVDKNYKKVDKLNLDDYYFRPSITQATEMMDNILRGMVSQSQETQDQYISIALTDFFNKRKNPYGVDLEGVDITRATDLGLPTYNEIRGLCGLKIATDFDGFSGEMSQESISKLRSLYSSHEDVPLFVGGMEEDLLPGTLVGPTFQCIIGEQFYNFQKGDQFYYENLHLPSSFSKAQREAIYKTTLAWIFCKTGDNIQSIPFNTFKRISYDNPIIECSKIPSPEFSAWKEDF